MYLEVKGHYFYNFQTIQKTNRNIYMYTHTHNTYVDRMYTNMVKC